MPGTVGAGNTVPIRVKRRYLGGLVGECGLDQTAIIIVIIMRYTAQGINLITWLAQSSESGPAERAIRTYGLDQTIITIVNILRNQRFPGSIRFGTDNTL